MARNRASGVGLDDLPEAGIAGERRPHRRDGLPGAEGMRDEHPPVVNGFALGQPVLHVLLQTVNEGSAVLFSHLHFPAGHFDAGLDLKELRALGCQAGATPALVQIVQAVDYEAGVYFRDDLFEPGADFLRLHAGFGHFRRVAHQVAAAGGKVQRVDHVHVWKFRRRKAGVLIAGGKERADADVDHRVVFFGHLFKKGLVFGYVYRGGAAHFPFLLHIPEDVRRGDVDAVPKGLASGQNMKRRQRDVPSFQQFGGEVAGAVCGYLNHIPSLLF